jgi:MFS family permease
MMASQRAVFTATRTQTLTYLLAVCPFSIAFLVFVNSSVSFVVTELIGLHDGEGDAVGTLGFADELLALAACPLWGVLSDRIGVRHVRSSILSINIVSFSLTYSQQRFASSATAS